MTPTAMRAPHFVRPMMQRDAAAVAFAAMRRPTELWLLASLSAAYLLVYLGGVEIAYWPMNVAGPIALTVVLAWSCSQIVLQSPIAVWAPLFWFRLACATYYGFGALVPHIANAETLGVIFRFYYFDDELNIKINLVYTIGIFITLLASYFFMSTSKEKRYIDNRDIYKESNKDITYAAIFVLAGGLIRYGYVIPYYFGSTGGTISGIVVNLSWIYYAGIYLLIYCGMGRYPKLLPFSLVLCSIDIVVSVASFAKTELLLLLIFSYLGFISRGVSRKNMLIGASLVLLAFFSFQPLVGYGRDQLSLRYNSIQGAGLEERLEIVETYWNGGKDTLTSQNQSGLSRFTYVYAAAFGIDRYDVGAPGSTLRDAAAVFVPRLLWPEKPIITKLGTELDFLIRGRDGSAMGIGHFAEAYWNFGWLGIAPFMAVLALILSVCTKVSLHIMARQDWLLLPVVLLGVKLGLRVDGHFVPDILGPAWMAVCTGALLIVARKILGGSRGVPRRNPPSIRGA